MATDGNDWISRVQLGNININSWSFGLPPLPDEINLMLTLIGYTYLTLIRSNTFPIKFAQLTPFEAINHTWNYYR